ncbi:YpzG family protein [Bacillus kexueae]|uniref:YpzG family protein n=1 Tax=Aeribacillus kexueae TaxID=2078952 RepID=UPI001FAFC5C2|nr:YpzG family protein [Bacillus kexueae]
MGSNQKKKFNDQIYSNPFQGPRANPKHAHNQVNGETQQSQDLIILEHQTRKRS